MFALHCDPRLEVGKVGTRVGPITSACDVLEIRLTSPGGHTSRPHLTADLIEALGVIITQLPLLLTRQVDPRSGTVLVWGAVQAGEAANAIPQHGVSCGARCALLTTPPGASSRSRSAHWSRRCSRPPAPAIVLDARPRRAAGGQRSGRAPACWPAPRSRVGRATQLHRTEQSSGGEDFAWYLEHAPGAMARLGVWPGHGPMRDIHQPTFDLDERALPFGVRILTQTALIALTS